MDRREFWSTKSPQPEYHGVTFEHPAFEAPFRLVANQFTPVTLGGKVYTPAPMTRQLPEQRGDATARLTLAFPRAVVGREFKRQLRRIGGSRDPITVTYAVFLDDLTTPALTWRLYVAEAGGVTFTPEAVQVTATDDNPMRRAVAPIYEPAVFTGLELI